MISLALLFVRVGVGGGAMTVPARRQLSRAAWRR
jgi:hypothetical protein